MDSLNVGTNFDRLTQSLEAKPSLTDIVQGLSDFCVSKKEAPPSCEPIGEKQPIHDYLLVALGACLVLVVGFTLGVVTGLSCGQRRRSVRSEVVLQASAASGVSMPRSFRLDSPSPSYSSKGSPFEPRD